MLRVLPRPGAAKHVAGASPPRTLSLTVKVLRGLLRAQAEAGIGDSDTCREAPRPRPPRPPALLHLGLQTEEPGCAQSRGGGTEQGRASPRSQLGSGLGPQHSDPRVPPTSGSPQGLPGWGATHLLRRSGGAGHLDTAEATGEAVSVLWGQRGPERGLAGSSEGEHLPAKGPPTRGTRMSQRKMASPTLSCCWWGEG